MANFLKIIENPHHFPLSKNLEKSVHFLGNLYFFTKNLIIFVPIIRTLFL